jgi:hypothetical protein
MLLLIASHTKILIKIIKFNFKIFNFKTVRFNYHHEAILYTYQVHHELVTTIMSIYNGAKAGLLNTECKLKEDNTFQLNVGVVQGDKLAPYLFIIKILDGR